MASGKTHKLVTEIATIPVIVLGLMYTDIETAFLAGLGCMVGVIITPDLDQEGINMVEWQIVKKTKGLGFLWLMFWYPYAIAVPHRAFISHFPLVGTFVRLLYIAIIPVGALVFYDKAALILDALPYIFKFAVGLAISDFLHWIFDIKI